MNFEMSIHIHLILYDINKGNEIEHDKLELYSVYFPVNQAFLVWMTITNCELFTILLG